MSVIFWAIFMFIFVIVVAFLIKGCTDGCTDGGTSEGNMEQQALEERRTREAGFQDGVIDENGGHANVASIYIIDQAPPAYTVVTAETNYLDMEFVAPPTILVPSMFVSTVEFAEPGHRNGGFDEEPPPPYPGLPR